MAMDFTVLLHLPNDNANKIDEVNLLFHEVFDLHVTTEEPAPSGGLAPAHDRCEAEGDVPFTTPLFMGEYFNLHRTFIGPHVWWEGEFLEWLGWIAWPDPGTVQLITHAYAGEWEIVHLDGTGPSSLPSRGPGETSVTGPDSTADMTTHVLMLGGSAWPRLGAYSNFLAGTFLAHMESRADFGRFRPNQFFIKESGNHLFQGLVQPKPIL